MNRLNAYLAPRPDLSITEHRVPVAIQCPALAEHRAPISMPRHDSFFQGWGPKL